MLSELNFAQRERLAFIDFCLAYFGQVSRADLVDKFQTGLASCSRDLSLYKELAPDNAQLVHQTKQYLRTKSFKPLFDHNPEVILSSLSRGFGDGLSQGVNPSQSCYDAIRLIHPKAEVISAIMRAIYQGVALRCRYESLSSGTRQRTIVPHSVVNNGHRWHVRAFDRNSREFRDFVCTRFHSLELLEGEPAQQEKRSADQAWNTILPLSLVPHPKLPHSRAIEMDYEMVKGELKLEVRAALAGYLLRQWNVDCSPEASLNPTQYQLHLANTQLLTGVSNLSLAPGYNEQDS